jgi:hypothetical protein
MKIGRSMLRIGKTGLPEPLKSPYTAGYAFSHVEDMADTTRVYVRQQVVQKGLRA